MMTLMGCLWAWHIRVGGNAGERALEIYASMGTTSFLAWTKSLFDVLTTSRDESNQLYF